MFCVHLAANTLKMNCIFSQWISSINREALPLIRNPNSFKIKALTEKLFTSMLPLKDTSTCTRSLLYLFLLILFLPYQFLLAFLYLQHRLGIYVDSCKWFVNEVLSLMWNWSLFLSTSNFTVTFFFKLMWWKPLTILFVVPGRGKETFQLSYFGGNGAGKPGRNRNRAEPLGEEIVRGSHF